MPWRHHAIFVQPYGGLLDKLDFGVGVGHGSTTFWRGCFRQLCQRILKMAAKFHELLGQQGFEFCTLLNHGGNARARGPIHERLGQWAVGIPIRPAAFLSPAESFQVLLDGFVSLDALVLVMPDTEDD
jgi:hypothetical protein